MNHRENLVRAYRFRKPEWIPVASGLPWLDWAEAGYDVAELESICARHEFLFPNLQALVNGIDNLAKHVKGRVAIDLDIDRQSVTVNGCGDIDDHIRECVAKLGSPAGGLWLCYQPWPPTPPRNLDAVFAAMEKYRNYGK